MYSVLRKGTKGLLSGALFAAMIAPAIPVALRAQAPSVDGCPIFPADHVFNTRVDNLPVHPNSDAYVAELGAGPLHPDWGEAVPGGYPLNVVHGNSVPPATVNINWPFTSDTGPFPIPYNAVVGATGDAHLIVLDIDNCMLYESFDTIQNADGSWTVDAISKFNLNSDALKPADWSSSNAAGTAQLPLLVRYDEVAAGAINHAISMTGSPTGNSYVWPASHFASATSAAPPMGTRFRLKADYDISNLTPQAMVVAQALKTYGAILTDNGASWHIQGVPDPRFDDADLHSLTEIPASAFEAVDESSLEISPTSGQVSTPSNISAAPTMGVTPSSGNGATQTFVFTFTDATQTQEHLAFNSAKTGDGACYLIYDRPSNNLYIANDLGNAVSEAATPGTSGTLSNSQCSVPASSASVSVFNNTVSVSVTISFAATFAGPMNSYAWITDASGEGAWQQVGTWTMPGATVNPPSGSGSTQTFVFSYADTNQMQEHLAFNSSNNGYGACYLIYDRPSNNLYIANDQGNAVSQVVTPGGSGTLSNDQCSVPASSASVSTSGGMVNVSVTISFAPSFAGPMNSYAWITDASGVEGGWQQIGTWTP